MPERRKYTKVEKCSVTPMQNGGFRAECHVVHEGGKWCGWWFDTLFNDLAGQALREHMKDAHNIRHVTTTALP